MTDNINLRTLIGKKFKNVSYRYEYNNHTVFSTPESLIPILKFIRDECKFIMLLDICGVDNIKLPENQRLSQKRFECVYHLLNMEEHERLRLRIPVDLHDTLPSAVGLWKTAQWFERESWEMFGIQFSGDKKERLLTYEAFVGHPLQKTYQEKKDQTPQVEEDHNADSNNYNRVTIGPTDPVAQGSIKMMLSLEGETVQGSKIEIGHLHRCFEKICETSLYNQIIPYTDRLNYHSAAMNNIGWCKTVEELMKIEIPDKAKALRMIFAELSRIIDHLMCIGNTAVDAGAMVSVHFCFELRNIVYTLFEKICGAKITVSLTRIGGMAQDIPPGWTNDCLEVIKIIEKKIEEIRADLTRNNIWLSRTKICAVSVQDAIEWGYTGPTLRACGVNYDIRRVSPYYFYDDIEFEIPLGVNGDCYDRYLVRMEEIRQSIKIIIQLLDGLPAGSVITEDNSAALPAKKDVYSDMEALMKHFELITKGVTPPVGEIYSSTEAANGELGFYIVSDGNLHPYRVKVRPPCYPIFQSLPEMIQAVSLSDAIIALSSINVVPGELDR